MSNIHVSRPSPIFPRYLPPDASKREVGAFLADLLDWLTQDRFRRERLAEAGLTETDLFMLRRVGQAFRTDAMNPSLCTYFQGAMAKLEAAGIVL